MATDGRLARKPTKMTYDTVSPSGTIAEPRHQTLKSAHRLEAGIASKNDHLFVPHIIIQVEAVVHVLITACDNFALLLCITTHQIACLFTITWRLRWPETVGHGRGLMYVH